MKNITKNYTNVNTNYSFALQCLLRNLFRYDPTIVDGCLQQYQRVILLRRATTAIFRDHMETGHIVFVAIL